MIRVAISYHKKKSKYGLKFCQKADIFPVIFKRFRSCIIRDATNSMLNYNISDQHCLLEKNHLINFCDQLRKKL